MSEKDLKPDHELKTWPEFFVPIISGEKTFEIREETDRVFKAGQWLRLNEWDRERGYTGRSFDVEISYLLSGSPWLNQNYVCMAIKPRFPGYTPPAEVPESVRRDTECAWTEDEDGNWDSQCGDRFTFIDSGPSGNSMEFCCYCGRKLKEVRFGTDE